MSTAQTVPDDLRAIMNELVAHGVGEREMQMWSAVYPLMTDSEQKTLRDNVEKELEELKKVSR